MKIAHFYHVYAAGYWQVPVNEHCALLTVSDFTGEVHIGLVGSADQRAVAESVIRSLVPNISVAAVSDVGFEEITLRALRSWCKANPSGRVLYTHAKGAYNAQILNDNWRRGMEGRLISDWRDHVRALDELDLIGSHWLTPAVYAHRSVTKPFFGGNFWWANASYIAGLPDLPRLTFSTRGLAEAWVGQDNPAVKDLCPGWPTYPA